MSRLSDGSRLPLAVETIVGRSRGADLRIEKGYVSSLHAALVWNSDGWGVRDLGSRNGTQVNGDPVRTGMLVPIQHGDRITFGNAEAAWRLVDASEPQPYAIGPEGRISIGADGLLAIPGEDDPHVTLFARPDGHWQLELAERDRLVVDREAVELGGETWRVRLPHSVDSTIGSRSLRLAAAQLSLARPRSTDATLHVWHQRERFSIPLFSMASVFLALATARLADPEGWVPRDQLLDSLTISSNHLNVVVFRLRQRFADAGFLDGAQIVERGHHRLRLGTDRIEIVEDVEDGAD